MSGMLHILAAYSSNECAESQCKGFLRLMPAVTLQNVLHTVHQHAAYLQYTEVVI